MQNTYENFTHTFAGNPLDRSQHLRRNEQTLSALAASAAAKYLPFNKLKVATTEAGALQWCALAQLPKQATHPVFLGMLEDTPHFAVNMALEESDSDINNFTFTDCRVAASTLSVAEAGIVSQARALLDWHNRNPYCAQCAQPTRMGRGGLVRHCVQCERHIFPRTDPVAIMLIQDAQDGDLCLLGKSQGRMANSNFYSALAGFVDQGESLEEAVRREVFEEAGIRVGNVAYHSSQPWPFPSSLMIGCQGIALDHDIVIDPTEMADVAWFSRADVRAGLEGTNPELRVPGPQAIAHHLIKTWAYS
jgi:NAD+ diphosphatase